MCVPLTRGVLPDPVGRVRRGGTLRVTGLREDVVARTQLLKRVTICKVANHKWAKIPYPGSEGAGYFLRCLRCGKERHGGTSVRPTAIM